MGKKKGEKPGITKNLKKWFNNSYIRFFMYVVLGVLMYFLLMGQVIPTTYDLTEGQKSPVTLTSPITVVNEWETNRKKDEAAKAVEDVYTKDDNTINEQINQMELMFNDILQIVEMEEVTREEKINLLKQTPSLSFLKDDIIDTIAWLSKEKITNLKYISKTTLELVMTTEVKVTQLESTYQKAKEYINFNPYDTAEQIKQLAYDITEHFIKPNMFLNSTQTILLRQEAKDKVQPVVIKKDEDIVGKGQTINKAAYEKLRAAGLLKDTLTLWPYVGLFMVIFLLLLVLYYSIERMKAVIHQSNKMLSMLFIIIALTYVTISIVGMLGENSITSPIGYFAPVAFGVMLITLLFSLRFAILTGAIFSIFASLVFNSDQMLIFDFRYGFVLWIGSTAGAFAIGRIKQRSSILKAGIFVALFNVLSILVILMLTRQSYDLREGIESVLYGVTGGIFSAVLTIGFLPFFETVFGILSPVNLIELSNPNHPLLRKLLIETPGTYHHSIIVGNLAESAAEAIGADGLLARVGAYYHDLGKTKRPTFFIENQLNMENPHDKISPNLSKKIILSHTIDGAEMLKQHKLPVPIQDIALQHHGTTLVKYFYNKVVKESDQPVDENEYRYHGPKPQTKEAAIVGIADSIEAAIRSVSNPTNEILEEKVRGIIKSKLDDGQLNECDLTLKELEVIAVSMLETIKGIFHSRIEYPDDKDLNLKGENIS